MDPNSSNKINLQNSRLVWGIVALVIVVGLIVAGLFLFRGSENDASQNAPARPLPEEVTVRVTDDGFDPEEVTINVGAAVRWVNDTDEEVTVNSDEHPTHQEYPPLNKGVFQPDATVVHEFDESGTYTYHDHFHPERTGIVVVEE